MTMLERVARAIWRENKPQEAADYDDLDFLDQGRVKMIARACIQEMREPSDEMLLAAYGDSLPHDPSQKAIKEYWIAMVDAAVREEAN